MTPSWLPDWRDAEQYPGGGVSPKRWAWEFLRRDPEYQADFREFESNLPDGVTEPNDRRLQLSQIRIDLEERDGWELLTRKLGRKYGVEAMCDPSIEAPGIGELTFVTTWGPRYLVNKGPDRLSHHPDPDHPEIVRYGMLPVEVGEVVVKFDLSWPLPVQFRRLKDTLQRAQDRLKDDGTIVIHSTKPRTEMYTCYLRVLDAVESGADLNDVAATLFPKKSNQYPDHLGYKSAHNALQAARSIRDENYLYILLGNSPK